MLSKSYFVFGGGFGSLVKIALFSTNLDLKRDVASMEVTNLQLEMLEFFMAKLELFLKALIL